MCNHKTPKQNCLDCESYIAELERIEKDEI